MNQSPTMTLLDRFASCALQGLLASHSGEQGYTFQEAAQWAYQYAERFVMILYTADSASRCGYLHGQGSA